MRQNRVPKRPIEQITDLEDHLFLLREHLHQLHQNSAHLKGLAAELRLLLCHTGRTDQGLLWRLAQEYGIDVSVYIHHAGKVKADHPLARGLHFGVVFLSRPNSALEKQLPAASFDLRWLIEQGEAVFIAAKSYTHEVDQGCRRADGFRT